MTPSPGTRTSNDVLAAGRSHDVRGPAGRQAGGKPGNPPAAHRDGARPELREGDPRGGGRAVVIAPLPGEDAGPLLDGFDGVCLSGGPDIHPSAYGRDAHSALGPT